jgi:hypothetical protein
MSESEPETVHRREAKSGRVSYGNAVVLHETSKRRVVLVPFYIPRTEGTDLAVKIITYQKQPPPMDWAVVESKSVSLNESASRTLLNALRKHLAVAETNEDGSYLVLRVAEGTMELGEHDPAAVAKALTKVLNQQEIIQHLDQTELSDELAKAFKTAIRLKEMISAVAQLREHLVNGENGEGVYQDWCEKHSWAFGNAYVMRDEVRNISPGDQLDILLPTVIAGYRDIVELKRPDSSVLQYDDAHRDYYFSADVSRAIGQCHRYLDVLHEVAAKGLRDHPEIVAYHPRAIIVIGRSEGWDEERLRALHGLNRRLTGITIMTYDNLLAQGERLVEIFSETGERESVDLPEPKFEADDDFPF